MVLMPKAFVRGIVFLGTKGMLRFVLLSVIFHLHRKCVTLTLPTLCLLHPFQQNTEHLILVFYK